MLALALLAAPVILVLALRLFPMGNVAHCRHHRVWLDEIVH